MTVFFRMVANGRGGPQRPLPIKSFGKVARDLLRRREGAIADGIPVTAKINRFRFEDSSGFDDGVQGERPQVSRRTETKAPELLSKFGAAARLAP